MKIKFSDKGEATLAVSAHEFVLLNEGLNVFLQYAGKHHADEHDVEVASATSQHMFKAYCNWTANTHSDSALASLARQIFDEQAAHGVIECDGTYEVVFVHDRNVRGDVIEFCGQHAIIVAIFSDHAEAQAWAKARNAE